MTLRLTLPDGNVKEFSGSVTGLDLAASIGAGLAKAALAIKLDGEMRDLLRPIERDAKVEIDERGLILNPSRSPVAPRVVGGAKF